MSPILQRLGLREPPETVAAALRHLEGFVFLDTAGNAPQIRGESERVSIIAALPEARIQGTISNLQPLREALATLPCDPADLGIPSGGLFGFVEYDGRYDFGLYRDTLVYDHATGAWHGTGDLESKMRSDFTVPHIPHIEFEPLVDRESFIAAVRSAQDYIAAGDIYQVNLSYPFVAEWEEHWDPFTFYLALRNSSPTPNAAFIDFGDRQVLSASPESFLRMSGNLVRTRPIKGTRPRFRDEEQDEKSAYDLITSSKEIAELVMITDLERNDLGRICEFGSVSVTELLKLERYEQVFHLVSTVTGTMRRDVDHFDGLAACFPGGSITGAPKKRAMEIISELEPDPRGLYTGAIGFWGANAESHFNIAIRTAEINGGQIRFHVGAGIVADSEPDAEYAETLHKAAGILRAGSQITHD